MSPNPNELIPCPVGWKRGHGGDCPYCVGENAIPRWVVETITTDGVVR